MRPVVWSFAAQRDVARIYRYLNKLNSVAAQRVTADIYAAALILKRHPYAGRAIRSGGGKRKLVVGDYILVYRVRDDTRILRVWHGAQDRPG